MTPVILVGLRRGQPDRDRNWKFNRARWSELGWPICEGYHETDGPFSMAVASNRAAQAAEETGWDVALYVGADFYAADLNQAEDAVAHALRTGHFTLAHTHLTLLDEQETAQLVDTGELSASGTRHPNTFSGVLSIPRVLWQAVGGFDERIVGWGWDDWQIYAACSTVGGGFARSPGDIYHLHHPRSWEENEGNANHNANLVLGRRYLDARGNLSAMRAIMSEPGGPLAR